jgi:dihydrofolate reductase
MRKLFYSMLSSLDLYVEGPDGQFGWATPDAELHKHFNANAATMTTHLYGRRMWETLSAYWPTAESDPAGTPETREFAVLERRPAHRLFPIPADGRSDGSIWRC